MKAILTKYLPATNTKPTRIRTKHQKGDDTMYTTQKQVRTAFWEAYPDEDAFPRKKITSYDGSSEYSKIRIDAAEGIGRYGEQ